MGNLKSFFRSLIGVFKSHPILTSIFLILFVAFGGSAVLGVYNRIRTLPLGDKLPAPKV